MSSYLFQMKFFPAAPVTPAWSNASSPVSAGAETSGHVVTKLDAGNPSSATLSQQCMFKWKRKACWLASTTSGAPARDNLAETTFKRPAKQQHRELALKWAEMSCTSSTEHEQKLWLSLLCFHTNQEKGTHFKILELWIMETLTWKQKVTTS